jgi:hypothetical protein
MDARDGDRQVAGITGGLVRPQDGPAADDSYQDIGGRLGNTVRQLYPQQRSMVMLYRASRAQCTVASRVTGAMNGCRSWPETHPQGAIEQLPAARYLPERRPG